MWKYPNALPTLSTWPFVISKLINGAGNDYKFKLRDSVALVIWPVLTVPPLDLMIPGLVAGSEGLPDVKEGDLVAICIHGYK
jgi:hypothetical protein